MIALITYENYPDGSPGAIRNHSFATALAQMGHNVEVIHKGEETHRSAIRQKSLYRNNKYSKWLLFWWRAISELRKLHKSDGLDAVIIYSCGLLLGMWLIKHWCKRHGVKVIFDVVEWYSKEQFKNGAISYKYQEKQIENAYVIDNECRVITISGFLENYYNQKGCVTKRIPIIWNKECLADAKKIISSSRRNFIYAGSHFEMDNIPLILESIKLLPIECRLKMRLDIYGFNEIFIKSRIGNEDWEKIKDVVIAHGRQPNSVVLEAYGNSDFTILLRDPNYRVNQAGFPSKVIESMAQGVSMMCNYSSDLKDFLVDGENSIIVRELKAESVAQSMTRIIELSTSEVKQLRLMAIETVRKCFCMEQYFKKFESILN